MVSASRLGTFPHAGAFAPIFSPDGQRGAGFNWDLAPDGKRDAAVIPDASAQAPRQEHEIVMLLNFADELRRRVPLDKLGPAEGISSAGSIQGRPIGVDRLRADGRSRPPGR